MPILKKLHSRQVFAAGATALALLTAGCGQEPSFLDNGSNAKRSSGDATAAADDQTTGDKPGADGDVTLPGEGDNGTTTTNPEAGDNPEVPPTIPAADTGDLDALHKCPAMWKNNPFTGTVQNYQKISASVTVGGFGNAINDTESTDQPFLILVDAGVNVLGSPVYNLLNKNGYYCIKANVNVLTSLTVNLHCNARLADQRVNVNVLSTQSDTTSSVGVHVLSNVDVKTVRPQGDTCIR